MKPKSVITSFLACIIVAFSLVSAQAPTGKVATAHIEGLYDESDWEDFDSIQKIFDLSETSLGIGHTFGMREKEAIKLLINEEEYYLIIKEVASEQIIVKTVESAISVAVNASEGIDVTKNSKKDVELTLVSVQDDVATVQIKSISEVLPEIGGDYKELFDIIVEVPQDIIFDAGELTVFMTFTNFGEGPSRINIVYSIFDESGVEFYQGIDDKVVYTEESLIKNFDFLQIPPGEYVLKTTIYYGDDQTATAEKTFRLSGRQAPLPRGPFIFIAVLLAVSFLFYLLKDKYVSRMN